MISISLQNGKCARGDAKILNFESACYSKSVSIPLRLQVARLLNLFMAFLLNPLETQTQVVQETMIDQFIYKFSSTECY